MKIELTARELVIKAQRSAVRCAWEEADGLINNALLLEPQEISGQLVGAMLQSLAADCEKLGLDEVMVWAHNWLVRVQPLQVNSYLRLAGYHERLGQRQTALEWLQRGLEATLGDVTSESMLRRVIRRVERLR